CKANTIGRFASSVAFSFAAASASAAPANVRTICGGWHSAFAETLASQFASQLAPTLQPPVISPPSHLIGSKSGTEQSPLHVTAPPASALHVPVQPPLHEPEQSSCTPARAV